MKNVSKILTDDMGFNQLEEIIVNSQKFAGRVRVHFSQA